MLCTPCSQTPDLQPPGPRCRADPPRPGERGGPSLPGPCASSPAVSGAAPLPLAPGSPATAALSPEPRPPGGGGRERERDLGSALGWPYPPRGPQFYCTPDPVRAVFCIKEQSANGGVSSISEGSLPRITQTVHASFRDLGRSLLLFALPGSREPVGAGENPFVVCLARHPGSFEISGPRGGRALIETFYQLGSLRP